jgi:cytoskeletal protein RodZ
MTFWSLSTARRQGASIFEVVLAAAALGMVLVMIAQAMVSLDRAQSATDQLDVASRELENSLKLFAARPWDELSPETASEWQLAEEAKSRLSGSVLETSVETAENPTAKRITMRLTLPSKPAPLVLTTWVFEPAGEGDVPGESNADSETPDDNEEGEP